MKQRLTYPKGPSLLSLPLVVMIAGCSMSMSIRPQSAGPVEQAQATPPAPKYLPDSLIDSDASQPLTVNSFGEFAKPGAVAVSLNPALRQHTFVTSGFDADVCVDAEGKWIAFAGSRSDGRSHLFRQGLNSPLVVQLSDGESDEVQPCISRDGRKIAFSSNRSGRWHVYIMAADGRDVAAVTEGQCDDMHPSFSPDGRKVVCCSQNGDGGDEWRLVVVDIASGQRQDIGEGLFPSWSPGQDADVIAFQKTRARGSRWFSIWTCRLSNGDDGSVAATQLTEIAGSTSSALVMPSWSPDGKSLTCSSISTGDGPAKQDIWTMGSDGRDRRRLTNGSARNMTPCWSSDGSIYFVSDRSGHECIWSLPTQPGTDAASAKTAQSDESEVEP